MKKIDKIRKIAVMVFVFIGLSAGAYEKITALPQHEGVGSGFMGDVKISVALDGDRIDSINVVDHSETEGISDPAFAELIPAIIESQDINVDNIAGATYTSVAIKEAVKDAAAKAGLKFEIIEVAKEEIEKGRGIEGIGDGYLDDIVVEVEKDGDEITNIWVTYHGDTESIAKPAFDELTASIIDNQHTEIDMVAGATWTSEGFIEAVEDALANIKSREKLLVTTGSGDGYLDDIVVEVARAGDKIVDIRVISHGDTESIAKPAFEELKEIILKNQSTDVDMIGGATWTSEGFLEAVKNAMEADTNEYRVASK